MKEFSFNYKKWISYVCINIFNMKTQNYEVISPFVFSLLNEEWFLQKENISYLGMEVLQVVILRKTLVLCTAVCNSSLLKLRDKGEHIKSPTASFKGPCQGWCWGQWWVTQKNVGS